MDKHEKCEKYCPGCRNNYYNGNNDRGIEECLNLKSAKVMWKKFVPINQRPPWNQKAERTLGCHRRKGYVTVDPDLNC